MQPQTLLNAYEQFSKVEVQQSGRRLIDNLRTTLRRYVLPAYGFTETELRQDLEDYLGKVPLTNFLEDATTLLEKLDAQINQPESQATAPITLKNYRSILIRFLNWISAQSWAVETTADPQSIPSRKPNGVQRYTPSINTGDTLAKSRRGGRQLKTQAYALKEEDVSDELKQQLDQFHVFWTHPQIKERQGGAIQERTFQTHKSGILCILGWQHNIRKKPLQPLQLKDVLDLKELKALVNWGLEERQNSYGWATNIVSSAIAVAKWLSSQTTDEELSDTQTAIQNYLKTLRHKYRHDSEPIVLEDTLTLTERDQVLDYLRQCCAPMHASGVPRSESAILKSWQRYLIVALLAYSQLRQGEIRLLEWGRSLIREQERYKVQLQSSPKSSRQEFFLPEHLTADIDKWRIELYPKIASSNNFVFTRLGSGRAPESLGQPLNTRDISDLVSTAIYKATSAALGTPKRISAHSFRYMTVTYLTQSMGQSKLAAVANQIEHSRLSPELDTPTTKILAEVSKPRSPYENVPPTVRATLEGMNQSDRSLDKFPQLKSVLEAAQFGSNYPPEKPGDPEEPIEETEKVED